MDPQPIGGVHTLADMTWEDVRALGGPLVAIQPVGATEAHGPHLPLGTDNVIAEAMAREGARLLAGDEVAVLLLPTLAYTAAPFASGFAGTVSVSARAVRLLLEGVATSLAEAGAAALAIANAHLDPAHVGALREAAGALAEEGRIRVAFADVTRGRLAERLTEEFRSGACHAGRYETSIIMAVRPDLVRSDIGSRLEPNPASLVDAIAAGHSTFEAAGGPRAYFGWPAEASAEEGRRTIQILGEMLAESVREALA
ncbi:MAG: creatininase family protein [Gemmatimonadota bacterium]